MPKLFNISNQKNMNKSVKKNEFINSNNKTDQKFKTKNDDINSHNKNYFNESNPNKKLNFQKSFFKNTEDLKNKKEEIYGKPDDDSKTDVF